MKTNVYVDGFNLYYGAVKGTSFKWLDLGKLCTFLLPGDKIGRIRYFTARIQPRDDPQQPQRQLTYLRALETIPILSVHYGSFLTNAVRLPLDPPPKQGPATVRVLKTEEKGSDVNLATYLLADAFDHEFEMAVIVSNDSDLALPIDIVQKKFGLRVGVLCPHARMSWELGKVASFQRPIRKRALAACQFPAALTDQLGTITKPAAWVARFGEG